MLQECLSWRLKNAGKLEMSKPDGAVDSHEREIKCLGLSYTFKANCAILLSVQILPESRKGLVLQA